MALDKSVCNITKCKCTFPNTLGATVSEPSLLWKSFTEKLNKQDIVTCYFMTWVQSSRLNLRINGSLWKQWAVKPCFHSICFVSTWTWPWVESFHHLVIRECGYVSHSQIFGIIYQIYYCPHACFPQNMTPLSRGSSTDSSFKKSTKRKAPPPPHPEQRSPTWWKHTGQRHDRSVWRQQKLPKSMLVFTIKGLLVAFKLPSFWPI